MRGAARNTRVRRRPAAGAGAGIRFWWDNRGQRGLTIERYRSDQILSSRVMGPRGRLTLDEAAAVLERPIDQVRRALRAGFLRAVRGRRPPVVTVQATADFLFEERATERAFDRAERRIASGQTRVIPWPEARARL